MPASAHEYYRDREQAIDYAKGFRGVGYTVIVWDNDEPVYVYNPKEELIG